MIPKQDRITHLRLSSKNWAIISDGYISSVTNATATATATATPVINPALWPLVY
jgi:hypothetical protein